MSLYVSFVLMSCNCFSLFLWLMIYGHHVVLSLLKVDTQGMCCIEGKKVMCVKSCYRSLESCFVKVLNE